MNDKEQTGDLAGELATLRRRVAALEASLADERHELEHLRQAEARWHAAVNNASAFILIVDRNGTIQFINHVQPGLSAADALGRIAYDFVHPEYQGVLREHLQPVFASGEPCSLELIGTGPNGHDAWYEARIGPVKMDGQIVAATLMAMEITERKQVEATLLQERNHAQQYLDVAAVIMVVLDCEGKITLLNRRGYEVLGYPDGSLLGQDWFGTCVPEPLRAEVLATFRQLMAGQLEPTEYYENPVVTCSGEERIIAWHNALLTDAAGRITGTLSSGTDITARKQTEEALRTSEERYRTLAESTTDVVYIVDRNGTLLYANRSAAAYMRLTPSALVGMRQQDLFPPEMAKLHMERLRRVFETGEIGHNDELFHFGSERVWLNIRSIPLRDELGQITAVMGVCRNITDRKRAEEVLQRAHDELEVKVKERTAELAIFHKFVEASGRGFGMVDLEGNLTYANATLCRLFGETVPEDVIGRQVSGYYPGEFKQRRENEIIPMLRRNESWHGEQAIRSRNGALIPTLQNGFLIRDENGEPFRFGVAVADMSELKQAEAALRASEERYELAVRGAGVGIFDWNILTGKVYYSPRWKALLGYEESEIGDAVEEWSSRLPPEERDSIIRRQEDFFADTPPTAVAEYRLRHKDGSYRWIEASVLVVRDSKGRACRLVGSHGDITDRKRAEEALEREHHNLRHLLQSSDHERQLIAYEIHDGLAQQLAGALLQFETFAYQKNTQPQQAEDAFHAGLTMLRQSHFEARRLIAGVRPPILDEAGVMSAIAHLVHEPVRGTGQQIDFHSRVQFDRLAPTLENGIYRIVQEGLTNACQHSNSEKVRVSLLQRGDRVRIEIRDWGTGFDANAVHKNRFGLEGIRQRARLLGGKCSIRSKPGKGTTITVELPVVARE